eukprot:9490366-Pyramimonas_sp.AAC.1
MHTHPGQCPEDIHTHPQFHTPTQTTTLVSTGALRRIVPNPSLAKKLKSPAKQTSRCQNVAYFRLQCYSKGTTRG